MSLAIGIDIGGTKIAGALVDPQGNITAQFQTPTDAHLGGAHVLETSLNLASQLLGQSSESILGIGVGAGGQIDHISGLVVSATDVLPGWTGTDIAGAFKSRFGVPVAVDNDVNALASGELLFGAARNFQSVAYLTLGTGVGGAITIKGDILHGSHFTAGELGHILIDSNPNARIDIGGARGTLEAYCSGSGLYKTYAELEGCDSYITNAVEIGHAALRNHNSVAADAVRQTGRHLGLGLATIANILDPDIIIIGGGLASLGDLLLEPAREVLKEHALAGPGNCPVITATLGENASVIGAASLVFNVLNHRSKNQ